MAADTATVSPPRVSSGTANSPPPEEGQAVKRSLSEDADDEPEGKRQRTSRGKTPPRTAESAAEEAHARRASGTSESRDTNAAAAAAETEPRARGGRRRTSLVDEKQRGKRLFGALLGSLNPPGAERASKRRQEIEDRRKAELRQQDDVFAEDRRRDLERLAEHRRHEQCRVDEDNMRIRHQSLLDRAKFLLTETEPRLYYRPWELTSDEEDQVDDQLRHARTQIATELDEVRSKPERDRRRSDGGSEDRRSSATAQQDESRSNAANAQPAHEDGKKPDAAQDQRAAEASAKDSAAAEESRPDNARPVNGDVAATSNDSAPNPKAGASPAEAEDEGDHVVEGDEDTVIY